MALCTAGQIVDHEPMPGAVPTRWTRPQQVLAAVYGVWSAVFTLLVALAAHASSQAYVAGVIGAATSALRTATGATRTTELMRSARGILLDLTGQPTVTKTAAPWTDRVDVITAAPTTQTTPAAMLIRPDGHIAWTSTNDASTCGLRHALHRWFGSPARTTCLTDGQQ